jgi:3-phytase
MNLRISLVLGFAIVLSACGLKRLADESSMATVLPVAETDPVESTDDAADDPAIWVHPDDPALSLIIGSQKKFGLLIYGLDGRLRQSLPVGRVNNVDLRDGFRLGGKTVAIVAGSNRTTAGVSVFALDAKTRELRDVAAGVLDTGFAEPYGLCLYRSRKSGEFFVFVNDKSGPMRQWRLRPHRDGRVAIELAREFKLDSQPEGCVADDEAGVLYVGEEKRGVWKMDAEPDAPSERSLIDGVGAGGHLVADVEGMSLWTGTEGRGYLVVSSQGENAYAVYERQGTNRYLGKFRIGSNAALGVDGTAETDGLDITARPLGSAYPRGLLVVQDGVNELPPHNQNFKLVPWSAIEGALSLPR